LLPSDVYKCGGGGIIRSLTLRIRSLTLEIRSLTLEIRSLTLGIRSLTLELGLVEKSRCIFHHVRTPKFTKNRIKHRISSAIK